ncbi:MAG: putative glycoside hydrolase [Actinomycetota bacterium]|nr:putative glycoside hydrolase [Actinomycetota bacterium]
MPRLALIASTLTALVLSSCAGSLGVQPGDAVVPPEMGDPTFEVVVLAADDLGEIEATVVADGERVARPPDGDLTVVWHKTPIEFEVSAEGFQPFALTLDHYPDRGRVEFRLEPVVLQGRIVSHTGRALPGVAVTLGEARDTTDNEGRYALARAVPGTITLSRPAWESIEFLWNGVDDRYDMSMSPRIIRAIRITPEDVLDGDRWNALLVLADTTGLNAVVVDLKTEDGTVVYSTEVAAASAIGAVSAYFDVTEVVADVRRYDLYLIGRIGVFQDNFLAAAEPDHAVVTADGSLWRSRNGFAWLDPSDPVSFEYSVALAEEACKLGFDEIQFDYVSYPLGGDISTAIFDGAYNQEVRVASINAFLTRAYSVLHPLGCAVSATLLGIVLESSADEGVGQRPGSMSRIVDVLSATLYTTNYLSGWMGFENPNDHAVEVVETALRGGEGKLDGHGYLRPWLQTWTISEADQRAVQSGVTEGGMGWMLWSNNANYSARTLPGS